MSRRPSPVNELPVAPVFHDADVGEDFNRLRNRALKRLDRLNANADRRFAGVSILVLASLALVSQCIFVAAIEAASSTVRSTHLAAFGALQEKISCVFQRLPTLPGAPYSG